MLHSQIHRKTLANGIVAIAIGNPSTDIMAARFFSRGGSRYDPTPGTGNLMASAITKGTANLSSMEIAERAESVGASLGTDVTSDYFLANLKTVSSDFGEMLALTSEILREPSFPAAEVELEKRLTLQSIRSQREQPFSVAFSELRSAMYGQHPYALSTLGTEDDVATLVPQDLHRYHRAYLRPDNLIVTLVGCIEPDRAIALLEETFGDWEASGLPTDLPPLPAPNTEPRRVGLAQDTQQSIVMLGYSAPSVLAPAHPDEPDEYAALKLLNTYLGNGLSSRLFVELREKRGLAYDVSAFFPTRVDLSQFVAYIGTAPANTEVALDGLQAELDRLVARPLDPEELETSKRKLLGQYALGKQTNAQIAQILGWYETIGLGTDFDERFPEAIEAVTVEAAQETARKYFSGTPYISVVGPEAAIEPVLGAAAVG
ncbi:MAG: M16 family metallopeptidase [Geitlerinemataceae cyanobacterium]